ncbi:MAG TPA: helix-turn-helix transcriptional regulator [Kofleriaceae bacterium]
MENKEVRRLRLLELAKQYGTLKALAEETGTDPAHLSQIKNSTRDMGEDVARRIEQALKKPAGWMDAPPGAQGPLADDELEMLEKYRRASPRWRLALRYLADVPDESQDEVSESVNVLMAKIFAKPVPNQRVEEAYGRPPTRVFSTRDRNKTSLPDAQKKRRA